MSPKKRIILLSLALLLAILILFNVNSKKNKTKAKQQAQQQQAQSQITQKLGLAPSVKKKIDNVTINDYRRVLISNELMQKGDNFQVKGVRWANWPVKEISDDMFLIGKDAYMLNAIKEYAATAKISAGEPITGSKISKMKKAGYLAKQLTKGMRAMTVMIQPNNSVGGFIMPGDRIDILFLLSDRASRASQGSKIQAPRLMLEKVYVLAVNQNTDIPSDDLRNMGGSNLTLELTAAQIRLMEHAQRIGSVSYLLRSAEDFPFQEDLSRKIMPRTILGIKNITPPMEEEKKSVTYVKGGNVSSETILNN